MRRVGLLRRFLGENAGCSEVVFDVLKRRQHTVKTLDCVERVGIIAIAAEGGRSLRG